MSATVREEWGLECPRCYGVELHIEARVTCLLSVDGLAITGEPQWDESSLCTCDGCKHTGPAEEFAAPCKECGFAPCECRDEPPEPDLMAVSAQERYALAWEEKRRIG